MADAIVCDRCGAVVMPVKDAYHVTLAALCKDGTVSGHATRKGDLCSACATGFKAWYYQLECSNCGPVYPPAADAIQDAVRYCPNCGAKVVEQ